MLSMFSRYFVIGFAAVVAVLRARSGAWPDAIMLGALALGLTLLRLADTQKQPLLKNAAWLLFAVSLVALGIVFQRNYL